MGFPRGGPAGERIARDNLPSSSVAPRQIYRNRSARKLIIVRRDNIYQHHDEDDDDVPFFSPEETISGDRRKQEKKNECTRKTTADV